MSQLVRFPPPIEESSSDPAAVAWFTMIRFMKPGTAVPQG